MTKKRIPMRKCVVTNEMKPKSEMIRIVKTKNNDIFIDETGKKNGRGAYVSLDPEIAADAKNKDILSSILKTNINEEFYDKLIDHMKYQLARIEIMKQNE